MVSKKTVWTCPICGGAIAVRPLSQTKAARAASMVKQFDDSVFQTLALGEGASELVREEPARAATIQSEVWVPALTALISGAIVGGVFVGLTVAFDWSWAIPVIFGSGTGVLTWFALVSDQRQLLRKIERWTSKDIDGDGHIGEPMEHNIRLEIQTGSHQMKFVHLEGVDPNHLRAFVETACRGAIDSYNTGLSRRVYNPIRDRFVDCGWLRWRYGSANQGLEITLAGKRAFEQLRKELE